MTTSTETKKQMREILNSGAYCPDCGTKLVVYKDGSKICGPCYVRRGVAFR